jgi:hypothetical protein
MMPPPTPKERERGVPREAVRDLLIDVLGATVAASSSA